MSCRRRQFAAMSFALLATGVAVSGALFSQAKAATPTVHGFATVDGTTTGGAGGETVKVASLSELKAEAKSDGKKTIEVQGLFTCSGDVAVASDKSVVGVGSESGLVGCGLSLKGSTNVVIQNLNISKVDSGSGDAIHLDEGANHVWIDHNTLSSDQSHGKDYYDGLIDITHASDYVTVSWNYLHDHYKAILVGHSDTNAAEDTGHLHVTCDHNYFKNIGSRTPSLRFGTGHVYNNYFESGSTGVHSRMGAQMLVQNNVFRDVKTPIMTTGDSTDDGYVNLSDNDFGTGENKITKMGTFTEAPYSVTLDATSAVVNAVTAGAGAGHI
jgi:pectate lyase